MRQITLHILFLWTLRLFGQTNADWAAVDRIASAYDNDSIAVAKDFAKKFLFTTPNSKYRIGAIYYLAEIANKQNNIDSALILYKQVLDFLVPDTVENNYQNYSCKTLSEIYIDKKDFKNAIKYLYLTKKKFQYKHFCGNAYSADNKYITELYADCYIGEKKYNKAIEILSSEMFPDGLASNERIVDLIYSTYLKLHSKQEIKNEFLNIDKSLVIEKKKKKDYVYLEATVKIFNQKVYLPTFYLMDYQFEIAPLTNQQQKQKCIEDIKSSEIYKLTTKE